MQYLSDLITFKVLNLKAETKISESVNFFIYDAIKILLLIFIVITTIQFIRTFFEPGKIKKTVGKMKWGTGNVTAALFGALTPFCSCSSIPLFIGFLNARIPTGIAFSFLITSPLVNEVAFVIMGSLFGWKLALLYALSGITLGTAGGLIIGSFKPEKYIILESKKEIKYENRFPKILSKKIKFALRLAKKTLKKLYLYVLIGVGVGAIIHGYVPQEFFLNTIGKYQTLSVPIATIIGIPVYAGCSAITPLIFTITKTGIPLGTSLAFMMAIAGLSLPEAIILKRTMKIKLLGIFFSIVAIGIITIGFLFNTLYNLSAFQ